MTLCGFLRVKQAGHKTKARQTVHFGCAFILPCMSCQHFVFSLCFVRSSRCPYVCFEGDCALQCPGSGKANLESKLGNNLSF